jgi:hypothetical protein
MTQFLSTPRDTIVSLADPKHGDQIAVLVEGDHRFLCAGLDRPRELVWWTTWSPFMHEITAVVRAGEIRRLDTELEPTNQINRDHMYEWRYAPKDGETIVILGYNAKGEYEEWVMPLNGPHDPAGDWETGSIILGLAPDAIARLMQTQPVG